MQIGAPSAARQPENPKFWRCDKHLLPILYRVGVFGDLETLTGLSMGEEHPRQSRLQFEHPSDVAERVNLGTEFWFQNMIAIRGGYNFNNDTETFTAGLGFMQDVAGYGIKFDYAYAGLGDLTDTSSLMNSPHRFVVEFTSDDGADRRSNRNPAHIEN
jgi:hypothetical protein